jgi:hypothetical protein
MADRGAIGEAGAEMVRRVYRLPESREAKRTPG